jgi:hypothetical protein
VAELRAAWLLDLLERGGRTPRRARKKTEGSQEEAPRSIRGGKR